jgi:hypothetical protein
MPAVTADWQQDARGGGETRLARAEAGAERWSMRRDTGRTGGLQLGERAVDDSVAGDREHDAVGLLGDCAVNECVVDLVHGDVQDVVV